MANVKVRLLRPLNNEKIGKVMSYDRQDAERLSASGAVRILGAEKPRQARKAPARSPSKRRRGA